MQQLFWILAGIAGGVVGGMGMGGGTLLIPILTLALQVEQKTAQLINLTSFLPMSAVALWLHTRRGLVDYTQAAFVALPAVASAVASAALAGRLDGRQLSRAFGVFLTVLGVWMLAQTVAAQIRDRRAAASASTRRKF